MARISRSHIYILSILQISDQLKSKELRINELVVKQLSDSDAKKLQTLEAIVSKGERAEAHVASLERKIDNIKQQWAQARGNEDVAVQNMLEQQSKFEKRWSELSAAMLGSDDSSGDISNLVEKQQHLQAKEIAQLQHKLHQSLENVRQAETVRQALKDALELNESLQGRLDAVKPKMSAMRNNVMNGPQNSESMLEADDVNPPSSVPAGGNADMSAASGDGISTEKFEKLQREHRRMRKDIATIIASKEATKAKLERAEKERDSQSETNARLLKQITEKDEVNAKSLSSILHLKSMTEQLSLERDNLEQQAKSASQLALAARLAVNAKEKLSEEIEKEKKDRETKLQNIESQLLATKGLLEKAKAEYAEAIAATATLKADLANAQKRCEELVGDIESKNSELRSLADKARKAELESQDATGKLQKLSEQSGGDISAPSSSSGFTVDQLNTQIAVLKNRLACPVCHYRDKECIIMRCRHMHCKPCVDERVSNRSRKCPTCNIKFSENDVEDIWLK